MGGRESYKKSSKIYTDVQLSDVHINLCMHVLYKPICSVEVVIKYKNSTLKVY